MTKNSACHASYLRNQTFINYDFWCTRFRAHKTVLVACLCTWEIMHKKEQVSTLLIITYYRGRNFTKLVLKPLSAKNGLSISVLCTVPFLYIILFQFTWWLCSILVHFLNWNEKWWSESDILNMYHELILKNSSWTPVYTLQNNITYLKAITYLVSDWDRPIKPTWSLR